MKVRGLKISKRYSLPKIDQAAFDLKSSITALKSSQSELNLLEMDNQQLFEVYMQIK
jgi:hypothetical protein